jgi:enterochelin esterase family protein
MPTLHTLPVSSDLLRGNPCGDPHERTLIVLAPEGVRDDVPLPAVWMLPAHGSSQGGFLANDPWREGLPQRLDRLWRTGSMAPARFVLPDLFTRFGGCQLLDSDATGPYARHLRDELVPLFEGRFATTARGAAGHSSGGYGALVQAMRHPGLFGAVACHAGDMLFDLAYQPDFPKAAAAFQREGGVEKFFAAFLKAPKKQDGRWLSALNVLAMAACYSPDEAAPLGLALPFDTETCETRPDVWARWLENDPVRMVERPGNAAALGELALLFLDVGKRDEWNLQWGARAFVRRLKERSIAHVYEEFDDGHTGTAYRFDRSLPLVVAALAGL